MFLAEIFKRPVPYEKVHEDKIGTSYAFVLNGVHYEVYFEYSNIPAWQREGLSAGYGEQVASDAGADPVLYVEFSTMQGAGGKDRYGLTNRGEAPSIFSTVISIIGEVLKSRPVRYLKFDAKESNRQSLYKKIAQRFGKEVYEISRPASTGIQRFGDRLFFVKVA